MTGGGLHIADLVERREIRRDSRGVVYTAHDPRLDRSVLVHAFPPLSHPVDRDAFSHQAQTIGRLSAHPNIATVFNAGFTGTNDPFVITEETSGVDLATHIRTNGPLQWTEAADITIQLCAGLEQAHRAGILHRDIRPETIRLNGTTPKLTDFALTVFRPPDANSPDAHNHDPAQQLHRAPETFDGIWDERSDLYSLASTLYQLIDGHAPMWRPSPDTVDAFRLRLANQGPPPLPKDRAPAPLDVFVTAALSKDPMDRPQSAAEFSEELRLIREGRLTGMNPSVLHNTGMTATVLAGSPTVPTAAAATVGATEQPLDRTMISSFGREESPAWALDDRWSPPADWAPPLGVTPAPDGTAVLPITPDPWSGPEQAAVHAVPPTGRDDQPQRSPLFLAALGLLVVSVVGFLAAATTSILGSDGQVAAPLLPDPDAPTVVQANGDGALAGVAVSDGAMPAEDAMAEEMTTTTAGSAPTTETTVTRLQVPNLVGQNVESAARQLTDLGFSVEVVGRQTANVQPGTVIQQKPDAGNLVALPLSVVLYIPRVSSLPPMVGRSADAVCVELRALGLVCNRVNQNHDQIPAGSVIATNPVEGARFSEGSSVALTVSTGPVTNITIPDVAGLSREEAEAALSQAGFITIAFATRSADAPKDQVFGSSPAAGEILASNRPITILISTGSATPAVPELVGRTQAEAEQLLTELGLAVQITAIDLPADDPGIGMVVATDPEQGTEVALGSTVTITVGTETMTETDTTTTTTEPEDPTPTTEPMTDTTVAETPATTTTTVPADPDTTPPTEAP